MTEFNAHVRVHLSEADRAIGARLDLSPNILVISAAPFVVLFENVRVRYWGRCSIDCRVLPSEKGLRLGHSECFLACDWFLPPDVENMKIHEENVLAEILVLHVIRTVAGRVGPNMDVVNDASRGQDDHLLLNWSKLFALQNIHTVTRSRRGSLHTIQDELWHLVSGFHRFAIGIDSHFFFVNFLIPFWFRLRINKLFVLN